MQIFGGLVVIGIIIAAFIGWVLNIIKMFGVGDIGVELIVRIIGIFVPFVGAIGGYF